MLAINLIEKYDGRFDEKIEAMNLSTKYMSAKFRVGDIIQFLGGYNGDILYTSRITGFDDDGGIYLVWDCYWFPIRDEEKRHITLIK
jgi:hypothetical protein